MSVGKGVISDVKSGAESKKVKNGLVIPTGNLPYLAEMKNIRAILIVTAAILVSTFLHLHVFTLPIQGKDSWRQSKTAWNIRYFVRHDSNILNPRQPYLNSGDNIVRYEFPIMQWSIAMVEKITGEHIIVLRSMIFLISLLTLFAVFKLALLLSENLDVAAITLWIFAFLPTFFYNATNIMPDALALCFGMYYVLFFFRYLKSTKRKDLLYSALFIALAGLAKLPYILLGVLSVIRAIGIMFNRQPKRWRELASFTFIKAIALLPVLAWYAMVIPKWTDNNITVGFIKDFVGWPLFIEFLKNHIYVNFPKEILNIPALILLLAGVFLILKTKKLFFIKPVYFFIPLFVLFLYFFYILNVIREGHEYYLMPFYPIFILPIIVTVYTMWQWKMAGKIIVGIFLFTMPFVCWNQEKDYWDVKFAYYNKDFFNCRVELEKIGNRDDLAVFINDDSGAILPYIADKSGYIFWNNHLPILWLKDMYTNLGARYLYSDSRIVEEQEGFNDCVSGIVLECGTLKVFKLKAPSEIQQ